MWWSSRWLVYLMQTSPEGNLLTKTRGEMLTTVCSSCLQNILEFEWPLWGQSPRRHLWLVLLWEQSPSSRRSNHLFSCSLSSFLFRDRLTSSLLSLLRYARKDFNKRYSFTTSSPKRKAVVKALPYLIVIKPTCWYPLTVILAMASHSATCKSCLMTGTLSSLPLVHKP